jgi:hypothetical protein
LPEITVIDKPVVTDIGYKLAGFWNIDII